MTTDSRDLPMTTIESVLTSDEVEAMAELHARHPGCGVEIHLLHLANEELVTVLYFTKEADDGELDAEATYLLHDHVQEPLSAPNITAMRVG
jgi:hypothetical protein